jgi:hypothetical protein
MYLGCRMLPVLKLIVYIYCRTDRKQKYGFYFLDENLMFNKKKNVDRHGPRPLLNIRHLSAHSVSHYKL